MPEKQIMTVKEVADFLHVSVRTLYRRITSGQLRTYKEGSDHRIRREWVEDYIKRCGSAS